MKFLTFLKCSTKINSLTNIEFLGPYIFPHLPTTSMHVVYINFSKLVVAKYKWFLTWLICVDALAANLPLYVTVYTAATYLLDMHILYIVCLGGIHKPWYVDIFLDFWSLLPLCGPFFLHYSINVDLWKLPEDGPHCLWIPPLKKCKENGLQHIGILETPLIQSVRSTLWFGLGRMS